MPTDQAHPDDPLGAFLASRDVPCWGCGYNLRGVVDPTCPECGRPLELAIARPGHTGRGYLAFLLVTLLWVLLASGMNAARIGIIAHQEASNSGMNWIISANGAPTINLPGFNSTTIPPPMVTLRQRPTTGAQGQVWTMSASRITFGTPAPGRLSWSQVRWQTWTALAWWSTLALAALTTILALAARAKKIKLRGPARAAIRAGTILFTLYACGHIYLFTREMIG